MKTRSTIKLSTFLILIFITLAVVVMFNQLVSQFQTEYPSVSVNDSNWQFLSGNDTKFSNINSSMTSLQTGISAVTNETGWAALGQTFQNLPTFITFIPALIFNSLVFVVDIFENILQAFGINKSSGAFTFLIMALTIAIIFAIVNFFNKTDS